MSKTQKFEFESLQDAKSIQQYLQSLIAGFENGKISLKSQSESIVLKPQNLLRLTIKAKKRKDDRSELFIAVSWKNSSKEIYNNNISIGS